MLCIGRGRRGKARGETYASVARILHIASQIQTAGFVDCESAEAHALNGAFDFELDLFPRCAIDELGFLPGAETDGMAIGGKTHSLGHCSDGGCCETAHASLVISILEWDARSED